MKKLISTLLTLIMVLSLSINVFASTLDIAVVDIVAPVNTVLLAPNSGGDITIELTVTGRQTEAATVIINKNWTLNGTTFVGSNPESIPVAPRLAQNDPTKISIIGKVFVPENQGAGEYKLNVSASSIITAAPAALEMGTSATYFVTVTTPSAPQDKTAPTLNYTLNPATPDGSNGWYKSDVTVTFAASDNEGGSGLATPVPQSFTLSDGIHAAQDYTVRDNAGNSTTVTVPEIKIDTTVPTFTYTLNQAAPDGLNSWYRSDVTVTFEASDNGSGLASSKPQDYTLSDGINVAQEYTVTDNAGNTTTVTVPEIKIDKVAPIITAADNQVFILNSSTKPVWDATDATSGINTKAITGFDTSTVGKREYTITATDKAGNTVTETRFYKVVYQIINPKVPAAAAKGVKAGSTVPISWQFADASGNPVDSIDAKSSLAFTCLAGVVTSETAVDLGQTAGASGLHYDATTQTWQFNWKTEKTTTIGTYVISIKEANGGIPQSVTIVIGK